MRYAGFFFTFIFLLGTASAQSPKDTLRFSLDDNLVHTSVLINGHVASAVLDSGTGGVVLDRSFARRIAFPTGGSVGLALGGGKPMPVSAVTIDRVGFASLSLSNVKAFLLDSSFLSTSSHFPVDVLLGKHIFEAQPIQVDYPNRRITLLPRTSKPSCSKLVSFDLVDGVPIIRAEIRVTEHMPTAVVRLIVDLGTRHHAMMLGGSFLSSPSGKLLSVTGPLKQIGTGVGGPILGHIGRLDMVRIGEASYRNIEVATTRQLASANAKVIDGALGVPFWISGSITFDYRRRLLCIET